jgi:hypothetical protein
MMKSKYKVYVMYRLCNIYVTTTRNAEDMINEILKMYDTEYIKIVRCADGEEETIYKKTPKRYREQ